MDSSLAQWCTEKASSWRPSYDWCHEMRPRPSREQVRVAGFECLCSRIKIAAELAPDICYQTSLSRPSPGISDGCRDCWTICDGERNGGVDRAWSSCHGGSRRRWRTGHAGVRLVDGVPDRQLGQHQLLSELMRRCNIQSAKGSGLKPSREKLAKVDRKPI